MLYQGRHISLFGGKLLSSGLGVGILGIGSTFTTRTGVELLLPTARELFSWPSEEPRTLPIEKSIGSPVPLVRFEDDDDREAEDEPMSE